MSECRDNRTARIEIISAIQIVLITHSGVDNARHHHAAVRFHPQIQRSRGARRRCADFPAHGVFAVRIGVVEIVNGLYTCCWIRLLVRIIVEKKKQKNFKLNKYTLIEPEPERNVI